MAQCHHYQGIVLQRCQVHFMRIVVDPSAVRTRREPHLIFNTERIAAVSWHRGVSTKWGV